MKIFCIGFHKTGISTLAKCLKELRFVPHASWNNSKFLVPRWAEGNYYPILEYAKNFKSFSDSPWNHTNLYEALDMKFPGSKFILTMRDPDKWFESTRKWATPQGKMETSVRKLPYGKLFHKKVFGLTTDSFDDMKDQYKEVYHQRNLEIKEYFKNRPEDFLILDWEKDDGWEKLCDFLSADVPNIPFPHLSKARY
jgi:hypothetical protein